MKKKKSIDLKSPSSIKPKNTLKKVTKSNT